MELWKDLWKDIDKHNEKLMNQTIEKSENMKILKSKLPRGNSKLN